MLPERALQRSCWSIKARPGIHLDVLGDALDGAISPVEGLGGTRLGEVEEKDLRNSTR